MRQWTNKIKQWSGGLALAGAVVLLVWTVRVARTLPPAPADHVAHPAAHDAVGWPEVTAPASNLWLVVAAGHQPLDTRSGPLAERYRLAGTFFALGDGDGDEPTRQAIIDDVQARQQSLVREGDTLAAEVVVEQVLRDHVVLRDAAGRREELWLSFSLSPGAAGGATDAATAQPGPVGGRPPITTSRFGEQVASNRWVFQRSALLDYYEELMGEPERLAAIYLTMAPDRDEEGLIAGYEVNLKGEGDFFAAVGLQPADVVRRVNSMRMTSQRRAEYFIGEFLADRTSALVLDIERDGEEQKLIYLIR